MFRFPEENMTAGRSVKPSSLIDRAIGLVKGFNPATQTVDSYADDAVEGVNADSSDSVFLKQVCTAKHVHMSYEYTIRTSMPDSMHGSC